MDEYGEKKFWASVDKKDPNDCWNWLAGKTGLPGNIYGAFTYYGVYRAHRVAWALANDMEVPEGKLILHKCNNKMCCNPNHLYCGTYGDNMADMMRDNPQAHGGYYAKLHEGEIWLIRKLKVVLPSRRIKKFKFSAVYVGKLFKVSPQTILRIWRNDTWLSKEGTFV